MKTAEQFLTEKGVWVTADNVKMSRNTLVSILEEYAKLKRNPETLTSEIVELLEQIKYVSGKSDTGQMNFINSIAEKCLSASEEFSAVPTEIKLPTQHELINALEWNRSLRGNSWTHKAALFTLNYIRKKNNLTIEDEGKDFLRVPETPKIDVIEIVMRHMTTKGCNAINGYDDLCNAMKELQEKVDLALSESIKPALSLPTPEQRDAQAMKFFLSDGNIMPNGDLLSFQYGAKKYHDYLLLQSKLKTPNGENAEEHY